MRSLGFFMRDWEGALVCIYVYYALRDCFLWDCTLALWCLLAMFSRNVCVCMCLCKCVGAWKLFWCKASDSYLSNKIRFRLLFTLRVKTKRISKISFGDVNSTANNYDEGKGLETSDVELERRKEKQRKRSKKFPWKE